jgi:hypothetical protein
MHVTLFQSGLSEQDDTPEQQKGESDIRLGYGVVFKEKGILNHDVSKFDLVIGMKMANITPTLIADKGVERFYDNCQNKTDLPTDIRLMCASLIPAMEETTMRTFEVLQRLRELGKNELQYILPGYKYVQEDFMAKIQGFNFRWSEKDKEEAVKALEEHIERIKFEHEEVDAMYDVIQMLFSLARLRGEVIDLGMLPSWAQEKVIQWRQEHPRVYKSLTQMGEFQQVQASEEGSGNGTEVEFLPGYPLSKQRAKDWMQPIDIDNMGQQGLWWMAYLNRTEGDTLMCHSAPMVMQAEIKPLKDMLIEMDQLLRRPIELTIPAEVQSLKLGDHYLGRQRIAQKLKFHNIKYLCDKREAAMVNRTTVLRLGFDEDETERIEHYRQADAFLEQILRYDRRIIESAVGQGLFMRLKRMRNFLETGNTDKVSRDYFERIVMTMKQLRRLGYYFRFTPAWDDFYSMIKLRKRPEIVIHHDSRVQTVSPHYGYQFLDPPDPRGTTTPRNWRRTRSTTTTQQPSTTQTSTPTQPQATRAAVRDRRSTKPTTELSPSLRDLFRRLGFNPGQVRQTRRWYPSRGMGIRRQKRQVIGMAALAGTIFIGSQLDKVENAVNALNEATRQQGQEIVILHDDMIAVAKASDEVWKKTLVELNATRLMMDRVVKMILKQNQELGLHAKEFENLHLALYMLMSAQTTVMPLINRERALLERMVKHIENLIEDLVQLKYGHLSPRLVPLSEMERIRRALEIEIQQRYPEYQLLMKDVRDVYSMNAKYWYKEGMIYITVPIYMTQHRARPMQLFEVQTVHVPYSSGKTTNMYTKLKTDAKYIAVTSNRFLELTQSELDMCIKHQNSYTCPQQMVLEDLSTHTCLSAIYFNRSPEIVKSKCDFTVFAEFSPPEKILEAGNDILIANVKQPWTFHCAEDTDQPEVSKKATYFTIPAQTLCKCTLESAGRTVSRQIDKCDDSLQGKVWYTINQALALYDKNQQTLMKTGLDLRFPTFTRGQEEPLFLKTFFSEDVIPQMRKWKESPLSEWIDVFSNQSKVWKSKNDKALSKIKDVHLGLSGLTKVVNFAKKLGLALAIGLPFISFALGCAYLCMQCKIRRRLAGLPKELWKDERVSQQENLYQSLPGKATSESHYVDPDSSTMGLMGLAAVGPAIANTRGRKTWKETFRLKRKDKPFTDPVTQFNLRQAYIQRLKLESDPSADKILHDEEDPQDIRKLRRLNEAGTTWFEIEKAINQERKHLENCSVPEFEAAIQFWKQGRRDDFGQQMRMYPNLGQESIPLREMATAPVSIQNQ